MLASSNSTGAAGSSGRYGAGEIAIWSGRSRRRRSVAAHHADAEPDQRPDQRRDEGEQPQRPGEAPEQERRRDALGVLDHEDEEQPQPDEGGDRAAAYLESSSTGGSVGGARRSLLDHEFFLHAWARRRSPWRSARGAVVTAGVECGRPWRACRLLRRGWRARRALASPDRDELGAGPLPYSGEPVLVGW